MALYTPKPGASVSGVSHQDPQGAASLERYVYGLLASLREEENNLPKIPERTDRITINVSLSKETAEIDLILNVVAANVPGAINYAATHYLTGSNFTSGTGGSAPNLAQAVMEGVVSLKLLELTPNRKLTPERTVITRCTHTVAASGNGTNATFSALIEFPIEVIVLPSGGSLIEGKNFLN
jgi:hypothetical protein